MTYKLLIVDDEMPNLRLLERLFSSDFHCLTASSGAEAIQLLEQHDVAILISDQRMPQMTGIDLLKQTSLLRPHMVRILLTGYTDVEALVEALNSGLVYKYVTKPWNNEDLKLTISRACEHHESNKKNHSLALANGRLLAAMNSATQSIVMSIVDMLKARDEPAYNHALRVRNGSSAIAKVMDLSKADTESLSHAALLHHLCPSHIFSGGSIDKRRPANLKNAIVEAQPGCEVRLLANIPELGTVVDTINLHLENFDGSGSPLGLGGNQIPLASRIIRVAHEYDSMMFPGGLIAPMEHDEALGFLAQRSGKQFDPKVIGILSQIVPEEIIQPQHPNGTHSNHLSMEHDSFEPAFVDAVFS